jgi:hypothetical protein
MFQDLPPVKLPEQMATLTRPDIIPLRKVD